MFFMKLHNNTLDLAQETNKILDEGLKLIWMNIHH